MPRFFNGSFLEETPDEQVALPDVLQTAGGGLDQLAGLEPPVMPPGSPVAGLDPDLTSRPIKAEDFAVVVDTQPAPEAQPTASPAPSKAKG